MPRGRFDAQPVHLYIESIAAAVEQAKSTGFHLWNDIDFYSEVEGGREFLSITGNVQCLGGIRVQVSERLVFARETKWSPRGAQRRVHLLEYSHSAILSNRGTIFRYDSPDLIQTADTPHHHRFHHLHRFDVLATGDEIRPPTLIPDENAPTLRQVLKEAEEWYYEHLAAVGER